MLKYLAVTIALFIPCAAQAVTHCQRDGGPEYVCHICQHGHNAMTLTEYECTAKEERRQGRDRMQRQCMVYLPDMQDAKLKRWCLKQSELMP